MSNSENFTSHATRWSATFGKGVARGWLAFVLVVACSLRWLTRQTAPLPGGSCARVLGLAASVGSSARARLRQRACGGVHRLRVLCGLAPLACGVLLMLAALPPEALASTNWATGVEAPLPTKAPNGVADLESVSCASAGNCTAVGAGGDRSGLMLTETSGRWATGVKASLPANAERMQGGIDLDSVSCASAGNCTAVGYYFSSGQDQEEGLLLTETSGRWATGVEASLPANANKHPDVSLGSVSCASAGNCTAVGGYDDRSGHSQGLLLTEKSGRWAAGVEASRPANAGRNPDVQLVSVSCGSAGNCSAVGGYKDSSDHSRGVLLTEKSGRWARGVEASLPAGAGTPRRVALFSVSCASAGNCTAVGLSQDSENHLQGLMLTETSGRWATGVEPSLPANAATIPLTSLDSVSCASPGNCTAVGLYYVRGGPQGLLLTERR
jgi:hypothetical protein